MEEKTNFVGSFWFMLFSHVEEIYLHFHNKYYYCFASRVTDFFDSLSGLCIAEAITSAR